MKLVLIFFLTFSSFSLTAKTIDRSIPINNYFAKKSTILSAERFVKNLTEVFPGTKSHQLSWLESDHLQRADFLKKTRAESKLKLKSDQYQKIYQFLSPKLTGKEIEIEHIDISKSRKIILSATDFERKVFDLNKDKKSLIFSSSPDLDHHTYIYGLYPSTDKKLIALLLGFDGSIDNTWVYIYDTQQNKIIKKIEQSRWETEVTWWTNESILFFHPESSSKGYSVVIENVLSGEQKILINHATVALNDWMGYSDFVTDDMAIKNLKTGQFLNYSHLKISSLIAEDDHYFYLFDNYNKEKSGAVYRLAKIPEAQLELFIPALDKTFLDSVTIDQDFIFVKYMIDATNQLKIFNKKAELIDEISIPNQVDLASFNWKTVGEVVTLNIQSSVVMSKEVEWTLHKKIDENIFTKDMFKKDDFEIETRIEYITSFDGEKIPIRLTYKKDLIFDQNRPVYMETYGGFLISGYMSPPTSKMHLKFIKQGGVVVGTGVRGGSEKGYSWFAAAAGTFKYVTSLDLAACAQALVTRGITQPRRIVSLGVSNGGYVVASAALMSPEAFGLVIPINGVQDQLNFTDLDRWGMGWQEDYTNPYEAKNYLDINKRAPLELKVKDSAQLPEFLIINGEQDTRVNKVHSYKLKAKLDEINQNKAILFSVDHAGHSPFRRNLGDIGIQANSAMWAKIFDFSGLQFE
jgi:prolyl oligopeptidase PreP (S9A serine peptidase family)